MNTSRVNIPACTTKSAFDANFNANASSRNPSTTFTELSHPPDFGKEFNQPGNAANKPKGNAKAVENPNIPQKGPLIPPLTAASTSKVPMIGPVQENETNESVKAIKKIPINPPLSLFESILFTNREGRTISNAPRNEIAKITNNKKNARLNHILVDKAFSASDPKMVVTPNPKST